MADQNPINTNAAIARVGLNTDFTKQYSEGELTYALNAISEGFDGNMITYQNEQGSIACVQFPSGYKVIGAKYVSSLNLALFFLTNPTTGDSEIGKVIENQCEYITIITDKDNSDKFNFSIEYPIHKVIVKTTNCSTQFYWTDGLNPRRYIDLDDLPWKEQINPNNAFKPIKLVGQLDANKLLVQPKFSVPKITPKSITTGGDLKMGTYQFAVQYGNSLGDGYTSYYSVTNPIGIFENITSPNFDLPTGKAIELKIDSLDTSGLYEYFNLAVIKTVNNITSVELVGVFPITATDFTYVYTGQSKQDIRLTTFDIFEKFPYYDIADDIFEVDNVLGWANLKKPDKINYQQIWSKVKLQWETWKIPYNSFEGYNNGINTSNVRGYHRDEVYAVEGCFILDNGEQTDAGSIPGRIANSFDLDLISNTDAISSGDNPCDPHDAKPRWQVYNTATNLGKSPLYNPSNDNNCYVGPWEYGDFAYWESTERYPNNPDIWGDLANKPIRHHKFPDSLVTHIHDNNTSGDKGFQHTIYPIGIKVDMNSLYSAIQQSSLTEEEKRRIVGFKILRGNRASNKSIIAKGIFHNVGKYTYKDEMYYYANYPFNDLRSDPYFVTEKLKLGNGDEKPGYVPSKSLNGFGDESKSRFVFHSPDTHFEQPFGINQGMMKLETIEYGEAYGHFVPVNKNAKYKFLSQDAIYAAAGIGVASMLNLAAGTFGWPTTSPGNIIPGYFGAKDLFEKIIPYVNFGYSFNSIGYYNKSYPIPNDVNNPFKIRRITTGQYITDGREGIQDDHLLNNFRRESAVYIKTDNNLLFPHEYNSVIPQDNSRYNISSYSTSVFNFTDFINYLIRVNAVNNITDDIVNNIKDTYGLPDIITNRIDAIFTINSMTTTNIPTTGDIYRVNGENYTITKVTTTPLGVNQSHVTLQGTITGNVIQSYNPPPTTGVLQLVFKLNSGSTSQSMIPYNSVLYPPVVHDVVTLQQVKDRMNAFLNSGPSEQDYNDLLNGDRTDRIIYWILNRALQVYKVALNGGNDKAPERIRESKISSYYGSIKRLNPNQWGRMFSYETIDTGFYQNLYNNNSVVVKDPEPGPGPTFPSITIPDLLDNKYKNVPTVFGGDIFINRFAYKSKVPFFLNNTFNSPDQADIEYDKLGNYGYPMFWLSTKPQDLTIDIESEVNKLLKVIESSPGVNIEGSDVTFLDRLGTILGGLLSGGFSNALPAITLVIKVFEFIWQKGGIANINLDNAKVDGLSHDGLMYLFAYGVPYFFVESEVNVDYRQAYNQAEGNFYPNVGGDIPDDWLQEIEVPIIHDNTYTYNQTYSKQNKENYFSHLREDYDPNKICFTYYPNRAIWSDRSNLEETKNNWLIYRPAALFDFPKAFGKLVSLDKLENIRVLARFEHKSQIYNTMTRIKVDGPLDAYLGNGKLFSEAPPIDLSETDNGYAGSQHKLLLRTEYGHIFTDAKRGQVILLQGDNIKDLANAKMSKWFSENLPFKILKTNGIESDFNIDSAANKIGLTGVYDSFYERVIITKLDYEAKEGVYSVNGNFYYHDSELDYDIKIELGDSTYFTDKSWTISYSFKTNSWVSYHSYTPNYYVGYPNYFQTGNNAIESLWNHNKTYTLFNNFFGVQYPYVIEYPFVFKYQDEILQNVKDYLNHRYYKSFDVWYETENCIFFNKAILWNDQQCTGILNLIPKPLNNMSARFAFPKYNADSKDIIVTRSDNFYNYNTFWDILKDTEQPIFVTSTNLRLSDRDLNISNLDYSQKNFKKGTIRGKDLRVREILDDRNDVKLISRFIVNQTVNSYK